LAGHAKKLEPDDVIYLPPDRKGRRALPLYIAASIGLLVAIIGVSFHGPLAIRRFMLAYLVGFAFVLSLSLGGLFFTVITQLFRAGWSVALRRPAEHMAMNLPLVAALFLPIVISVAAGGGELYPWAVPTSALQDHHAKAGGLTHEASIVLAADQPHAHDGTPAPADHGGHAGQGHGDGQGQGQDAAEQARPGEPGYPHQTLDDFTMKKRPWLNSPAFIARWVVFLGLWSAFAWWYFSGSVRQDVSGDWRITWRREKWAGLITLIFALTFTFGAWDLLMTLNPHWYSTIFGVYYFAGSFMAVIAALILIWMGLQAAGYVRKSVTVEHYHDLGKLLFAFVFFWSYIAFSQYMLLWYASLPETSQWLQHRGLSTAPADRNAWGGVALVLLFGHFAVPFVGLLSRHVKRRKLPLAFWAIWLLIMHWIDVVWLVMPEWGPELAIGLPEIGLTLTLLSVFFIGVVQRAARHALVPIKDPKLGESLALQNF